MTLFDNTLNAPKSFKQIENLFVHIGSNTFKPYLIDKTKVNMYGIHGKDLALNKPMGKCLWGFPIHSKNNLEKFKDKQSNKSFYFRLKGKIKVIKSGKDLVDVPMDFKSGFINWKRAALKYDAMIIKVNKEKSINYAVKPYSQCKFNGIDECYESLKYSLDTDSVIVFNPESVCLVNKYDLCRVSSKSQNFHVSMEGMSGTEKRRWFFSFFYFMA